MVKVLPLFWKTPIYKKFFPILIISLGLLFVFHSELESKPQVKNGIIYLENPTKAYHIVGEWLHWKDNSSERFPEVYNDEWKPINVPGLWENLGIHHNGCIFYKLEFFISRELYDTDLGLIIPNTALAYEVYINGKLIHSIGEIGKKCKIISKSTESSFTTIPKNYLLPKGRNILLIRVASYGYVGGFNTGNIYMGAKDIVLEKFLRSMLLETIILAIFFFIGLYHLVIYSIRAKDKEYLYYALLCLDITLYNLCFTTLSYWLWNNFYFYYFGVIFSVNLVPIFLVQFFNKYFESQKKFISKAIINVSLVLLFLGIIMNLSSEENFYKYNTYITKILFIVLVFSLFYPVYFFWNENYKEKVGMYFIFLGYLFFTFSIVNEIFVYLNIYTFFTFVDIGFAVFVISISLAMAMKFAKVHSDLEYLTSNLKSEVEKRTKELTETNQRLVEMDKIKTAFFANITHELRTPITLSLIPIEQLIAKSQDPESKELLETAHRNNIRLLKLINDLLDFSKFESGLMELRLMPTNVSKLIEELLKPFEINAKERGIQLEKQIQPDCIATIDPSKLEKIVTNLLSNAYKFTKDNGRIWIHVWISNDNLLNILVGDNGIGIPEHELEIIFERFRQLDMTSERKFEGTGIGLSLVKELTELHGGKVTVKSTTNEKTEFLVKIPIRNIENNKKLIEKPSENTLQWFSNLSNVKSPNKSILKNNSPTILIVEDNKEMTYLLINLLQDEYNLLISENGKDGFMMAMEHQPDLILSDIMMPDMNGYQLIKKIRESSRQIPIILLTAINELDNKLEGFQIGADDYISKPFHPPELKARIKSLIQKSNLLKEKNVRLNQLQRELALARDIQRKLLPSELPDIPELSLETMYIPLDEVGGDFYDIYFENNTITIFMADVSGHGVPACLIACMVKMAFQNEVREKKNKNISQIMKGINRALYGIIGNNFVTATIIRIFIDRRELRYITAGHPPFYYLSYGKLYQKLTKGKPLGIFENFDVHYETININPNDSIFLYTDGIIECTNPQDEFYNDVRLSKFIENHGHLEPKDIIDRLQLELKGFAGESKFDDDITAIYLKFHF